MAERTMKADDDMPAVVRIPIDQAAPDLGDTEAPKRGAARAAPAEEAAASEAGSAAAPAAKETVKPGDGAKPREVYNPREPYKLREPYKPREITAKPSEHGGSRAPFVVAALFTVLWALAGAGVVYGLFDHVREFAGEAGLAPVAVALAGAFGAPVVFFFALASMIARLNDLRAVSGAMAGAAMHFAKPEIAAHEEIVSIGQAVRREVSAIGDGVERALARAVELESLVNNELSVLERAYSENEVRIRDLLAGLAQQREILVGQAEQVRNAITHVHLDLSTDITTVSELIAERVNEAAQQVTRVLADKGEQITVALGSAGDTMIEQLGDRGSSLIEKVTTASEAATQSINAASDRMTQGITIRADQIHEQVRAIATNLEQSIGLRLDETVGGFSQKSATVLETVEKHTRELSATMVDRSEKVSQSLIEAADRIAETIAARAEEASGSLRTTGESIVLDLNLHGSEMVSKLEGVSQKVTGDGSELAARIARDSAQLGELITRHLTGFDAAVKGHGNALVESLAQRTAAMQEIVIGAVATRDDALASVITGRIDEANELLATRATAVAEAVEGQVGRFEELLVNRVTKAASEVETRTRAAADLATSSLDRMAHEVGARTGTAVERAAILVGKATEAIESRTHAAADFAVARLSGLTEELEQRSTSAADDLALRVAKAAEDVEQRTRDAAGFAASQIVSAAETMETRAVTIAEDVTAKVRSATEEIGKNTHSATDLMQARASELQDILDATSNRLIDAISSKGGEFAAEIENAAESAAQAIDNKAFAFTQSMMNNSDELARVITDASSSATVIVGRALREVQESTRSAIEQSKGTALSTVSEIHETHDMLRTDATALFERLRDANDLLQGVLSGARTNLSAIEQGLSSRVVEFVSTVERLLEGTEGASNKLDRQVSAFYALTSRVLSDLGDISAQFESHGKALGDAVTALRDVNDSADATVNGRKNALEELAAAVDTRTGELEGHLKRFSGLVDAALRSAEERARDAARIITEATTEGARSLAERHAAIRLTTEQESKQTLVSLRELHQRAAGEAKDLFKKNAGEAGQLLQQANDRFAEVMLNMKKMSADMQRELETTRKELRRGVLELPEETAESMAQMRRVIVDQMEALAELNRIVARHGRAMDVGTVAEPATRRGFGDMPAAMNLPEHPPTPPEPARGRAGMTDWNSLQQRGRAEAQPPAQDWNSPPRGGRPDPAPELPPAQPSSDWMSRGRGEPPEPPARQGTNGTGSRGWLDTGASNLRPGAPATPDAGKDGGGWLSSILTRASRDADPSPEAVNGGRPGANGDDGVPGVESVDAMSAHIARWMDNDVAAEVWERHDRGERGVNIRRLYTSQGRKAFEETRRRYKSDREFRQVVDRYVGQFDRFLSEVGHADGGHAQVRGYIASEAGQVYTMLAHAAGRFD